MLIVLLKLDGKYRVALLVNILALAAYYRVDSYAVFKVFLDSDLGTSSLSVLISPTTLM
jgi:hypothetical protein